ncbi:MAG TPA: ComEC/Rec2 family competence protein, partial [Terriglobales bacterium]
MKRYINTPFAPPPPSGRQPLLWAALAFAAGILAGRYLWRPPTWWILAGMAFAMSAGYFARRRVHAGRLLALGTVSVAGALAIQLRPPRDPGLAILPFADGREVLISAHVVSDGILRNSGFGGTRQLVDVETERIADGDRTVAIRAGLRISLYGKTEANTSLMRVYRYGERLKFPARLYPPRNFRNPGAFDYKGYLAEKGIAAQASAKAGDVEVLPGFAGSRIELWRVRAHRSITRNIQQLWPPAEAALLDAMLIGEDAFLTREVRTQFQRSGTYHVLVVSGMNVGILAFVVFWLLRRCRVTDWVASLLTVILAVCYSLLTDVGAPIWRATLMLSLYLGARLVYRERSVLNAIGAAALGLLLFDPNALFGASFQLTLLCVLLIAAVGLPVLERTSQPYSRGLRQLDDANYDIQLPPRVAQFRLFLRLVSSHSQPLLGKRIPLRALRSAMKAGLGMYEILVISAVMQIGLALPMAYYFHRATVVGLPANLLVMPLTGVLMPAAVLAVSIGSVSTTIARIPAFVAGTAIKAIAGTVRWFGELQIADARVATPGFWMILIAVLALAAAMLLARRRRFLAVTGLAAFTVSAFWIALVLPQPRVRPGVLEITAIDVGQGDSLLVVSPQGRTLLVDAGG